MSKNGNPASGLLNKRFFSSQDSNSDYSLILEQYKIYVEMSNAISERRDKTNNFFLTLNTLVIAAIGYLMEKGITVNPKNIILIPAITIVGICVVWLLTIINYKKLNSTKYEIIGELEEELPVKPWSTEWKKLDKGINIKKYIPLTVIEKFIPWAFIFLYIIGTITFLII